MKILFWSWICFIQYEKENYYKKENCYEEDQSFFSTFILLNDWFKKSSVFIMFYKGYPLDTFQAGI